ncbi:MFS transporter [Haloarchaeobius sp. HRN-SO-5]|uniref:MFS transporter n=1 Tax=Haloarchaeobius sp. HRN-SO-5 TaxID=3446118 RepID=UPI003EBD20CE
MGESTTVSESVDSLSTGPFHRRLLALTGGVLSFAAVEILVISFVLPQLVSNWSLSGFEAGLLGSASLIGIMLGNWVGGWYGDRAGRVVALQWSVLGYSLCAALTALSVGFYSAFVFRLLTGVFVGGTIAVDVSYLTEHLPTDRRGRYLVYLEAFWPSGTLLSVLVAWLVLSAFSTGGTTFGIDSWRVLFLFAALPALATPILRRTLAETPYYLAGDGRLDAANDRIREMSRANGDEFHPVTEPGDDEGESASFRRLFAPGLRGRTALVCVLWFGLNFGFYGVFIWLPSTFEAVPLGGSTYEQLFVVGAVQLPGVVSAALLVDRLGRRPTIGGYLFLSGIFMVLFADGLGSGSTLAAVVPLPPLASLFLSSFFLIGAWGPMFAYTVEVFPTSVRGTGFGFASGVGKIAAILGPVMAGALVPMGYRIALLPFGFGVALAGAVVLAVGPETRDEALS